MYRRSYLMWSPVIVLANPELGRARKYPLCRIGSTTIVVVYNLERLRVLAVSTAATNPATNPKFCECTKYLQYFLEHTLL